MVVRLFDLWLVWPDRSQTAMILIELGYRVDNIDCFGKVWNPYCGAESFYLSL